MKTNKNNYKISFILNITIFILTLFATIAMIKGFQFLGKSQILTANRIEIFKYFTVDSNILAGITSLVFAIYDYLLIKNKNKVIPKEIYILKHISTVSVMVTFLVTLLFLLPAYSFNFNFIYSNSNFLFHLVIPLLCLISFIFFEKNNYLNFKNSFYSLIPVILYSVYYSFISLSHIKNGVVFIKYDWYGFLKSGLKNAFIVPPIMYLSTYLIGFIIWRLNKNNTDKYYSKWHFKNLSLNYKIKKELKVCHIN